MECRNCGWNNSSISVRCEKCSVLLSALTTAMSGEKGEILNSKTLSAHARVLCDKANAIFQLDIAPDKTRRFIEINRDNSYSGIRNYIASLIGCEEHALPGGFYDKINDLEKLVNTELTRKNIVYVKNENFTGDVYLSDYPVKNMIPDTLLTQIIGTGSKLDLFSSYSIPTVKVSNTAASAAYGDQEFQKARAEVESQKYLAISLIDNTPLVIEMQDKEKYSEIRSVKKFYSEDISVFQPKVLIKQYGETILEDDYSSTEYVSYLTKVAKEYSQKIFFRVSRQKIATALATMFNNLAKMHKDGLVHCDLKPQNIFSFRNGLMPFDPINVRKGDISPGLTTNFCAPEQVLAIPVSAATDIYNLGLIILSIIDGIIYGKISSYVIPIGNVQVQNVKLISEPMIYIDYNSANVQNKDSISFWRTFLEKCLAFEQKNRFQNMDSFINEYNRLIELYPLKNDIEFTPNFGSLSLINDQEPVWLVKC